MELLFIGLAAGAVAAYFIFSIFNKNRSMEKTNEQSVVLMDKIRSVCKFITVEGDFSEIYHYENLKEKYISLVFGKKKAIVLVQAKAHVGFDLSKVIRRNWKEYPIDWSLRFGYIRHDENGFQPNHNQYNLFSHHSKKTHHMRLK